MTPIDAPFLRFLPAAAWYFMLFRLWFVSSTSLQTTSEIKPSTALPKAQSCRRQKSTQPILAQPTQGPPKRGTLWILVS